MNKQYDCYAIYTMSDGKKLEVFWDSSERFNNVEDYKAYLHATSKLWPHLNYIIKESSGWQSITA